MHADAQANARNSAIRRRTPAGSVDVDQFDPCGIAEPVVILIAPQPNSAQRLHRPVFDRVNVASGNIQLFEQVALTRERVNLRRKYKRRQPVVAAIYRSESEIAALRKIERRKRRSGTGKTTQPATVISVNAGQFLQRIVLRMEEKSIRFNRSQFSIWKIVANLVSSTVPFPSSRSRSTLFNVTEPTDAGKSSFVNGTSAIVT